MNLFSTVEVASVQRLGRVLWIVLTRHEAHCAVKLELVDVGGEVAHVCDVGGHVVLGTWIEIVLAAP